jgi:hypothetical protein
MSLLPNTYVSQRSRPLERVYDDIHRRLPVLIENAFHSYRAQALADFPNEAKNFAAAHAACRAALDHLMMLLRLADVLSKCKISCDKSSDESPKKLICQARAALKKGDAELPY